MSAGPSEIQVKNTFGCTGGGEAYIGGFVWEAWFVIRSLNQSGGVPLDRFHGGVAEGNESGIRFSQRIQRYLEKQFLPR